MRGAEAVGGVGTLLETGDPAGSWSSLEWVSGPDLHTSPGVGEFLFVWGVSGHSPSMPHLLSTSSIILTGSGQGPPITPANYRNPI